MDTNNPEKTREDPFMTSHLKYVNEEPLTMNDKESNRKNSSMNDAEVTEIRMENGERKGDVISSTGAVMTLSKAMFNAGCFSLPYAWKRGGLWVSFATSFLVLCFNWYGNHILVKSSQHLAKKSKQPALDYGHFAKKVCENSEFEMLRKMTMPIVYFVDISILFYQVGMCSVSILFISDNMVNLFGEHLGSTQHERMIMACTISLPFVIFVNMFTSMKVVTFFALISSIFFAIGMIVILQFTIRQPTQWDKLPAYTDFTGTTMMIGILMYSFEGQTMILPVENKLKHPEDFLSRCGVLPTTMLTCGSIMTGLGFFGYTGFGDKIAPSITSNVPKDGLYSSVNVSLMIQTVLVHSFALFVIIEVFYPGFQRRVHERYPKTPNILLDKGYRLFWVLLTYFLAIGIPNLEIMIPLVGVTSGTLCALVYPPLFEILTFWHEWQRSMGYCQSISKVFWNCFCVCIGICAICAGVYSNVLAIIEAFHPGKTQLSA